ncbi:MAG TPA: S9 family peptidase [Acidobacteriota bacterium]|nr:S9 family peptidase [Acidobacteriota bacterium]
MKIRRFARPGPISATLLAGLAAGAALPSASSAQALVAGSAPTAVGAGSVAQRPLLTIDDQFLLERVGSPQISPDGMRVAYTVGTTDYDTNSSETRIWVVNRDGGAPIPMTGKGSSASSPRWSPDGRLLSFLASRDEGKTQVWALDLTTGGEAVQLTEAEESVSGYEWSPDGRRMALSIKDPALEKNPAAKTKSGSDIPEPWVVDRLQFKRDYVGYLDHRRNHLYTFDLASKKIVQITSGDYDDSQAVWSPDSQMIAFVSNRTDAADDNFDTNIWLVDADNTDKGARLTQVTRNPGPDGSPTWSPDGRRIAHVTETDPAHAPYDIAKVAVIEPGGQARVLTEDLDRGSRRPMFTADGNSVYFQVDDSGERHLAMVPTTGGEVTRVIDGPRSVNAVTISDDGTIVALISEPREPGNLYLREDNGALRKLTRNNDETLTGVDLAEVENVQFPSADGTEIEGFIFKPPGFQEGVRYPTILRIHGGPVSQYTYGWNYEAQLFAANGYLVVTTNPRGSSGYGKAFQMGIWQSWGEKDTQDVIAGVDHAIKLGWADPDRLGVGGWSYGGILTNYVITQTQRFKAAIAGASGAHWISSYGHDHYQRWYRLEFGNPWEPESRAIYEKLSSYNDVDKITTPTMWVGGKEDWNVPIIHAEMMYQAVKSMGREALLVVYPNMHHGINLPYYRKDLHQRYLAWYDKYLEPQMPAAGE